MNILLKDYLVLNATNKKSKKITATSLNLPSIQVKKLVQVTTNIILSK